eukprot:g36848.t1
MALTLCPMVRDTALMLGRAMRDMALTLGPMMRDMALTLGPMVRDMALTLGQVVRDMALTLGQAVRDMVLTLGPMEERYCSFVRPSGKKRCLKSGNFEVDCFRCKWRQWRWDGDTGIVDDELAQASWTVFKLN